MQLSKYYCFTKFTLKQLFSLGAHVGHLKRRLNKSMSVFLLGFRNGLVCIDLNFTIFFLRRAVNFLRFILKSRGSVFFFVANWAPLQRYFRTKFPTRLHFWYSGPFMGGLLSNLKSIRYSTRARNFGNFFKTKILVPDVALLFDSSTFFYIYRDAFLLGIPSVGFVDTDLDYQNVLYPIILNNSSVKINFLYSVFFLNILKQEQFLERFFLVKDVSSIWFQKKAFSSFKFNNLFSFYLQQFLKESSFDLQKFKEEDVSQISRVGVRIRLFARRILLKQIRKFKLAQTLTRRKLTRDKGFINSNRKRFFFDVISLSRLCEKVGSGDLNLEKRKCEGRVVLHQLRRKRTKFFFVRAKLLFLRKSFSRVLKLRKLNFRKFLIFLRIYRQSLVVTIFSRRSIFRRLFRKLKLPNQLATKLRRFGGLGRVFNFLNRYFLKKDQLLLRRLVYISTRILTLLGSSRRKTTVMMSRLEDSYASQAILTKDFCKKLRRRGVLQTKVIRKIKLKGGFLVVKRRFFKKGRMAVPDFSEDFDIKELKRMRLRHLRNIIEAKSKYYASRRTLYEYNNLLNSRFKVERSMFKNLSGLVKKGLFRRSHANDRYVLRYTKKPRVIYSEINPKLGVNK